MCCLNAVCFSFSERFFTNLQKIRNKTDQATVTPTGETQEEHNVCACMCVCVVGCVRACACAVYVDSPSDCHPSKTQAEQNRLQHGCDECCRLRSMKVPSALDDVQVQSGFSVRMTLASAESALLSHGAGLCAVMRHFAESLSHNSLPFVCGVILQILRDKNTWNIERSTCRRRGGAPQQSSCAEPIGKHTRVRTGESVKRRGSSYTTHQNRRVQPSTTTRKTLTFSYFFGQTLDSS